MRGLRQVKTVAAEIGENPNTSANRFLQFQQIIKNLLTRYSVGYSKMLVLIFS